MSIAERVFNWGLGLSVFGWGILGLLRDGGVGLASPVRACIAILSAVVGGLVLVRRPLLRDGTSRSVALAIPSFLTAGVLFKLAPGTEAWPAVAEWIFVAGTAITVISMASLGRYFAILPAVRGLTADGPYRWVRHPIYVGELILVVGCVLAAPDALRLVGLGIAVALLVVRIHAEEGVLMQSEPYRAYAGGVAWRLVPGIW
jgi:protein-S-isoprenylcysteine O-methyltransferase Ste14